MNKKDLEKKGIKIYGNNFDEGTYKQIATMANSKALEGQNIAIMPDAHVGKGAVIGFTSTFEDKIIPNVVGVDVGCGMTMSDMPKMFIDLYKENKEEALKMLQMAIRKKVPHGFNVHKQIDQRYLAYIGSPDLSKLTFKLTNKQLNHINNSVGTLGGGNHFIELNETKNGELKLVVHSGSRNLGQLVAKHHQAIAISNFTNRKPTQEEIAKVEPQERQQFIQNFSTKKVDETPDKDLEYLVGSQTNDYLNDMKIAQAWAKINREKIIRSIVSYIIRQLFKRTEKDLINIFKQENLVIEILKTVTHTIHNYVDVKNRIIRKGAIFADEDNDVVIPLNMRDGSIIACGKGNKQANFSAPHGAGRIMSRMQARREIKLEDFQETMQGVTSWTVNENTIDEAPFAYKDKESILGALEELVEIKDIMKPVFNFKDDTPPRRKSGFRNGKC